MRYKPERALKQLRSTKSGTFFSVTTQAREGIETLLLVFHLAFLHVTTQAREGIETLQ